MNRNRLRHAHIAVVGGGHPHRHHAWPVVERIVASLSSLGYDAELVDAEAGDFMPRITRFDVAFLAHFGDHGDDGTLQGLLASLGIPYTGSGCTATAVAQDKVLSKRLLQGGGIATPDFLEIDTEHELRPQALAAAERLGLPLVIKPVLAGGSYGLRLGSTVDQVVEAIEAERRFGRLFAERFVRGRTLTAGVLGVSESLLTLPSHEVVFCDDRPFLDAPSLAQPGMVETVVPPRVDPEVARRVEDMALCAHTVLRAHGLSRSDFKVDQEGRVQFLELNTLPAMSSTSDLPIAARRIGLSFTDLVERILVTALERTPCER